MKYVPTTKDERTRMLKAIGFESFQDLVAHVPSELKFTEPLNLPRGLSEYQVSRLLGSLAEKNIPAGVNVSFMGAGYYDHLIPSAVDHLISRSEFFTAYTPYQAEVSQGTLTAIFEFQTMISEITGMEVANASMYDGATATAEAVLMASAHKKKRKVVRLSPLLHPHYIDVIRTYCKRTDLVLEFFVEENGRIAIPETGKTDDDVCWVVQNPNFFGKLEDLDVLSKSCHEAGALFVVSVNPVSLGFIEPPGRFDADIVTGEGQPLGCSMSFGGPGYGFMACRDKLKRLMPGRLVGRTTDTEGKIGYVLTLQTREQHIRRERATSNICTNQALCALAGTITMALLGKEGFSEMAEVCFHKAHYLYEKIDDLPGYSVSGAEPFFNEFVVDCESSPEEIVRMGPGKGFFPGVPLGQFREEWKNKLLIAVTEKRTMREMNDFVDFLAGK